MNFKFKKKIESASNKLLLIYFINRGYITVYIAVHVKSHIPRLPSSRCRTV